jgi:hypothetical protein
MMHDRFCNDGAEPRHALAEPRRHAPAMQRKVGASPAPRHRGGMLSIMRTD